MKTKAPLILTSQDDFIAIKDGRHTYKTSLTKKMVRMLPRAYESSTGTMLIFPHEKCPRILRFRPKWKLWVKPVQRRVINVMAVKNEDLSESLIIRLK